VSILLTPENLVPKLIEGQRVKAKDLLLYFKAYMNIFNGTELPEPKTILEVRMRLWEFSYDFIHTLL
jgi:atlastin